MIMSATKNQQLPLVIVGRYPGQAGREEYNLPILYLRPLLVEMEPTASEKQADTRSLRTQADQDVRLDMLLVSKSDSLNGYFDWILFKALPTALPTRACKECSPAN